LNDFAEHFTKFPPFPKRNISSRISSPGAVATPPCVDPRGAAVSCARARARGCTPRESATECRSPAPKGRRRTDRAHGAIFNYRRPLPTIVIHRCAWCRRARGERYRPRSPPHRLGRIISAAAAGTGDQLCGRPT